ncbi:hypothetical protein FT663_05106 [Candidozyma haemuli var. vulneris]|uniref:Fe2OG dioxygenase domain-containing protein n=1 Tax=Candidozyma haemuli TaxID=45357 RepID=A0A2V1ARD0_9ASCO|nr:hypothetical protein CXQ85_002420 [[Candida] haemuloni]KAF3985406.1 hypothetical protein FT662_05169 [[Candida] haemuloni var. vulneris]KAF3985921.1 hypothetical protein FT663_05106 [[Candida] haemuloni var. vulneris]PVH20620.1 hypothetical protein CXQ85_002420 [[Candida] haemuloni]
MSFQSIQVLDLEKAFDPETKTQFLAELRNSLINVGFLLLVNYEKYGPSRQDFLDIKEQSIKFFELPDAVKQKCEMINSPHFLGYTRLANEITASHTDWREQIDLATELPPPKEGDPIYKNIEGPNLWPDEEHIPGFRAVITSYIEKMTRLSNTFRRLACEAIGIPPDALDGYFKENQQCKMKLIAYPDSAQLQGAKSQALDDLPETGQGVGPHRDSDLLTYIYQATEHHRSSLQVQNFQGKWITVDNIPHSLVVNAGQTLEAITNGVCKATIHRVLNPEAGSGTRISVPFFQTIDLDSRKSAVSNIPKDVLQLRDDRDKAIEGWGVDVGFQFTPDLSQHAVGHAVFRNRIKSHQDVAARWYPSILEEVKGLYSH